MPMHHSLYETLRITSEDGIDVLTLCRPHKLNAVSITMAEELNTYFVGLQRERSVRVVIICGEGKHFCAGFDLEDVPHITRNTEEALRLQRVMADIVLNMRRCPQPVIALMHGAACGAGFAIALAADVRYAADDACMNVAMSRIGLTGCDMGISYFLPRAVGISNAAELMMTGRFADAALALRTGIVSQVMPRGALTAAGAALAREMTSMSPEGLRLTKDGLNASQATSSLEAVVALEDRAQVICIQRYMKEGVAAFLEKRTPKYAP
jgi:enoyl-CoA hydratase/carnithine racemase